MRKIAIIGGGSFGFTRNLVTDILSFPELSESRIALMDIDERRLEFSRRAVQRIIDTGNYPASVSATTSREEALEGADAVICTILVGGVHVFRHDVEIPKKYGVDINCGDTRGPAGIARAMRTIPTIRAIAGDMERLCPQALFLNYTNPMGMVCRAVLEDSSVQMAGLCHSVQHVAGCLAEWIGAPVDEVDYRCAGINHQAWFLTYRWNGRDAYPLIRKALERPEIRQVEPVMNEIFHQLGYYVTESSGHNSEYNPWFRKRPDLIEKYCSNGTGYNPGRYGFCVDAYLEMDRRWQQDVEAWLGSADPPDLTRGKEYAAPVLNAVLGDGTPFVFHGNVRNDGLIENLLPGGCVEVPIVADRRGLAPTHVGRIPDQLAALNEMNLRSEELAVQGILEDDDEKLFHAICFDPLTCAVLSLDETRAMSAELIETNRAWRRTQS